ncbi:hypothetical protein [Trujillonella endophytica]|uniref:Uncharacterized protein n=1 Tax=Trujillonella endophytica TaxID=673521 RepID=A0A1H8QNY0_9ACTN|nr:hypothetical protein [Trujillella endophytica]SEO55698.1 hypothetical protein SAMN05660991_00704 [Trujillella endophytica]
MPSDEELFERTLAFSDTYASDDGAVTIRRSRAGNGYSTARFTGHCAVCAGDGLTPHEGEPLEDLTEAARFAAAHRHGEVD